MHASPKVILLEFNELCPSLLSRYMDEGRLPSFRRLYDSSLIATTDAAEEHPNLEPWIQWLTVHSGMTFAQHGVFHLGDGRNLQQPCLAECLSDAGVRVGIFGSMNLNYRGLNGYLIPDAWHQEGRTQPPELQPFFDFVSRQVQNSSQASPLTKSDLAKFGACLLRNGISPKTVGALCRQLLTEKSRPALRWRRPSLLDRIEYDLFRRLNRRFQVDFATLFCNSTAHYQHYYWRNMQPELFEAPPPSTDDPSLAGAILYGYQQMDKIVAATLRDYPRSLIMLCTGLSQQPWTDTTKCTFRPKDFASFLDFAGIAGDAVEVKPVMAEEFHLIADDDASAGEFERLLTGLTVNGERLMHVERTGGNLYCGCRLNHPSALDADIVRGSDGASRPFTDLLHMVHSMRSGRHHPDGVWWIRTGMHAILDDKVPLASIAPSVLDVFGVSPPAHMSGETLDAMSRVHAAKTPALA